MSDARRRPALDRRSHRARDGVLPRLPNVPDEGPDASYTIGQSYRRETSEGTDQSRHTNALIAPSLLVTVRTRLPPATTVLCVTESSGPGGWPASAAMRCAG